MEGFRKLGKNTEQALQGVQRRAGQREQRASSLAHALLRVVEEKAIEIEESSALERPIAKVEVDDSPSSPDDAKSMRTLNTSSPDIDYNEQKPLHVHTDRSDHPCHVTLSSRFAWVERAAVAAVKPTQRRGQFAGRRHRSGLRHYRGIRGQRSLSRGCDRKPG